MKFHDRDFNGEEITLDGNTFTGCTFQNCTIIFRGTGHLQLSGNRFKEGIVWRFDGGAQITLEFLSLMYATGAQALVEGVFANVRSGKFLKP